MYKSHLPSAVYSQSLLSLSFPTMDLPLISQELFPLLQNPSLLYSAAPRSFSTWSIVVFLLTSVATAGIILLSKLQLSRFRRTKSLIRLPSLYYSGGDDDDDASTTSSDDESDGEDGKEEREEEEEDESEDFRRRAEANEVGNFSGSLADLVGGVGVVRSWDGFGLGFDRRKQGVSFLDLGRGEILRSFDGGSVESAVVQLASPAEIVCAADEAGGSVVRVWDVRAGDGAPAAAAWPLLRRRVGGVRAHERKVFVGDEGGEVAEIDLRKLAEVESGEGFGLWWKNAARCLSLLSPRLQNA